MTSAIYAQLRYRGCHVVKLLPLYVTPFAFKWAENFVSKPDVTDARVWLFFLFEEPVNLQADVTFLYKVESTEVGEKSNCTV